VQVLLLRVLESGEIYPVGSHTPIPVDVRLITATDADLEERINQDLFKAPLLHRLAGFEIQVPALSERREDIGVLFHHFARQELEALGEAHRLEAESAQAEPWLPWSLAVRLVRFGWPGNIRQLRNMTRQIIIGSRGLPRLQATPRLEQELDAAVPLQRVSAPAAPAMNRPAATRSPAPPPEPEPAAGARRKPSEVTDAELLGALRATSWDLKAAANRLGITRPSLYLLIDKSPSMRTAGDLSSDEITRCFEECQGDVDAMVQRLEVSKRGLQRRLRELGLTND
jgi:two-component system nitrogen regulation response regulator GlnG